MEPIPIPGETIPVREGVIIAPEPAPFAGAGDCKDGVAGWLADIFIPPVIPMLIPGFGCPPYPIPPMFIMPLPMPIPMPVPILICGGGCCGC